MKHRADVLQAERSATTQGTIQGTTQDTTQGTTQGTRGANQPGGRHALTRQDRTAPAVTAGAAAGPEVSPVVLLTEDGTLDPGPADHAVLEREPAHHRAETAAVPTEAEHAASPSASTHKWRTRSLLRSIAFLAFVAAAAGTGLAGQYYFESTTDSRMRLLITVSLVTVGLWALLTATAPQVVTLRGSILTVKSRRGTDRFDLAEGMTQLELIGDPRSSKWALVLHRGDNSSVRLGRRHVDARTLDPLVRKFREIAERRRSEHWARLGL